MHFSRYKSKINWLSMSPPFLFHNKKGENTGSRSIHNNNQWLFKQNEICKKNLAPYTGWWIQHPWKHIIWPFLSFVKHFCVRGCWKCTRVVNSAPCVGCRISFWDGPQCSTFHTGLAPILYLSVVTAQRFQVQTVQTFLYPLIFKFRAEIWVFSTNFIILNTCEQLLIFLLYFMIDCRIVLWLTFPYLFWEKKNLSRKLVEPCLWGHHNN